MKIKIKNLRDLPAEAAEQYLQQIAVWHCSAWGSITNKPLADFERNIKKFFREKKAEYFIAVDEETNESLGTISLKPRNMEDEYPDYGWGPWFSGLYVREQNRHQRISAMLGLSAAQLAQKNNVVSIYYFTHNLALADFYNQLQGEDIKPFMDQQYKYLGKPILVYAAKPENIVKLLQAYLVKNPPPVNQTLKDDSLRAKL
jgi:hypothetical protein